MKIKLLPSSVGEDRSQSVQFLTTYLVNDALALDAGSLGYFATLAEQKRVRNVVLSHSHTDHVGSLPVFLENVLNPDKKVLIHGSDAVLEALHAHVFNDTVWPALVHFGGDDNRYFGLRAFQPGQSIDFDGVRVTPVPVDHVVPTTGFLLQQGGVTVVVAMDTGPTDAIWRQAHAAGNVRAVFLEVTFPNAMTDLARLAKHLTPAMFAAEIAKAPSTARFVAVHIKAAFHEVVAAEIEALDLPNLEVIVPGREYDFS